MNKRLLTKEGRTACIPTPDELESYLATPDDVVAQKLRENLSPELFEKLGFVILYNENIEKAQDAKTREMTLKEVGEWLGEFTEGDIYGDERTENYMLFQIPLDKLEVVLGKLPEK